MEYPLVLGMIAVCTSMTMRLRSVMLSRVSLSISCASIGTDFKQAEAISHDDSRLPAVGSDDHDGADLAGAPGTDASP